MVEASSVDPNYLDGVYRELEDEARTALCEAGIPDERKLLQRWADCRYTGQAYELLVPAPSGRLDGSAMQTLAENFHRQHEREYAYRFTTEREVLIVHARVYGLGTMPELTIREIDRGDPAPDEAALVERVPVGYLANGGVTWLETSFYDATRLRAGNVIDGPAIVEHQDSTTVINPGLQASVDKYGNLLIDCRRGAAWTQ
jgi:N-methylhydantoinase A/oxoprolinase/acetone carboxylase beta subunit